MMPLYTVSKEVEFDAGHRVPHHTSKCYNLHGHRYRIQASVASSSLQVEGSSTGMVVDFGDLKRELQKFVDLFDHRCLIWAGDPLRTHLAGVPGFLEVKDVPTAENIARWVAESITVDWGELSQVKVWETPTSIATYSCLAWG